VVTRSTEVGLRLTANERDAVRGFRNVGRQGDDLVGTFTRIGGASVAAFAAFQVGGAVYSGILESVNLASDLNEGLSRNIELFGDHAGEIEALAEGSAEALGLSRREVVNLAGDLGALFEAVGLNDAQAADYSATLVDLSADIASFNNLQGGAAEAAELLRAGLAGEAEPLRRLGVFLSAAAVESRALELGLADTASALTEADKVTARYNIILEQTTAAQGDFVRTSDGYANSVRVIEAAWEDTRTEIGEALLPVIRDELLPLLRDDVIPLIRDDLAPLLEDVLIPSISVTIDVLGLLVEGITRSFIDPLSTVGIISRDTAQAVDSLHLPLAVLEENARRAGDGVDRSAQSMADAQSDARGYGLIIDNVGISAETASFKLASLSGSAIAAGAALSITRLLADPSGDPVGALAGVEAIRQQAIALIREVGGDAALAARIGSGIESDALSPFSGAGGRALTGGGVSVGGSGGGGGGSGTTEQDPNVGRNNILGLARSEEMTTEFTNYLLYAYGQDLLRAADDTGLAVSEFYAATGFRTQVNQVISEWRIIQQTRREREQEEADRGPSSALTSYGYGQLSSIGLERTRGITNFGSSYQSGDLFDVIKVLVVDDDGNSVTRETIRNQRSGEQLIAGIN